MITSYQEAKSQYPEFVIDTRNSICDIKGYIPVSLDHKVNFKILFDLGTPPPPPPHTHTHTILMICC